MRRKENNAQTKQQTERATKKTEINILGANLGRPILNVVSDKLPPSRVHMSFVHPIVPNSSCLGDMAARIASV